MMKVFRNGVYVGTLEVGKDTLPTYEQRMALVSEGYKFVKTSNK